MEKKKTIWCLFFIAWKERMDLKSLSSVWIGKPKKQILIEYGFNEQDAYILTQSGSCDDSKSRDSRWILKKVKEGKLIL